MSFVIKNKWIFLVLILGSILRVVFFMYGAEIYYSSSFKYVLKDTYLWQSCIENLINNGEYSLGSGIGYFARMPGYSFFMGIFYFFSAFDWEQAHKLIAVFQTAIDICCIYIFYKLSCNIFSNHKIGLFSGFLYATYPFIIVWNPICISEQWSTFLVICTLFFFVKWNKQNHKFSLYISSFFLAIASLTRPQILPLFPILLLVIILFKRQPFFIRFKNSFFFLIIFSISFSIWPLRNYINHGELIITKNNNGISNWAPDVISFMQYTYSVKAEWDPQYTSIINNKLTVYPSISYENQQDSIKLERAIFLSKNCGSGFSYKKGYWKSKITKNQKNCDEEISRLFLEIRNNFIKNNPLHFYIAVPFENLKKAIFKSSLTSSNSKALSVLSKALFFYRTLLILLGLSAILIYYKQTSQFFLICILFFIAVYFTLCFGTAPFMRNIEMRYFLPVDILLLLPASKIIFKLFINVKSKFYSLQHRMKSSFK